MAGKQNGKVDLPVATLEAIQAAVDVPESVSVPIPEWGVTVIIRGLKRGEIKALVARDLEDEQYNIAATALSLVEPKLTEDQVAELFAEKGMVATRRVTDAITEASGLGVGF